jgi:hypothetical protein
MSGTAVIAAVLLLLALVTALGALRCLADRLLPSAAIYTAVAAALAIAAGKAAIDAL